MLALNAHFDFHLYLPPTDMRKSFDGLCGLVRNQMNRDPVDGDIYLFLNRRRNRIKLLVWDRDGFWLFYKRLELGTFQLPQTAGNKTAHPLPWQDLMLLLEGIDLTHIKRKKRYVSQKKLVLLE